MVSEFVSICVVFHEKLMKGCLVPQRVDLTDTSKDISTTV